MAMNQTSDGYLLPCGRDVETVWDRLDGTAADGADAHERSCPHCGAAHESLRVLRRVTGELAADDEEPSHDLVGRIMSAVRAEIHRHDLLPLPTSEPGAVRVSEQAAAAVLRFAADSVDGVRARHCRVTTTGAGGIAVDLDIAVTYRSVIPTALEQVRRNVTAAATARIGVRLTRLNLTVTDLYDP